MPRDGEEQNCRQKLCQADVSQVERSLGDFVNLPAHGYRLHFDSGDDQEAGNLEEDESGMSKGGASSPGVVVGGHKLM